MIELTDQQTQPVLRRYTTLDKLAADCDVLYIDSGILTADYAGKERGENFADILGAAVRFSHVPYRLISRHARFSADFYEMIRPLKNARIVEEVLGEHEQFVCHLERKIPFLRRRSSRQQDGEKERMLRVLATTHRKMLSMLQGRVAHYEDAEAVAEYILRERLHISQSRSWAKKRGTNPDGDQTDAVLAAHAIIASQSYPHVAVVSMDMDIINIIFQYGRRQGQLQERMQARGTVESYFPDYERWNTNFGLAFMTDLSGNFAGKRLSRPPDTQTF